MLPGLVIDGCVKAAGRVPSVEEMQNMILAGGVLPPFRWPGKPGG